MPWWATFLCSVVVAQGSGSSSGRPRSGEGDDRPYVEILQSTGAIDGPAKGGLSIPRWERMRLDLQVENRLQVDIDKLELEIGLVSSARADDTESSVIPGWSFKELYDGPPLAAADTAYLKIQKELPARRTSPPADEIAYRVHILSYQLLPPDLDTAIRLLGSSQWSDQRAALKSYTRTFAPQERDRLGAELALALNALPKAPRASDALRMLFAVHSIGSLGDAQHVPNLLFLPDVLDRVEWGRAVIDLATRMVAASYQNEPRLRVLPTWAREQSALLRVRAQDALEDAVRDAILRMGDAAVPPLLLQSHTAQDVKVRTRAQRLLHALGRSTVRSQLSLRNRTARLQVIAALGELSAKEPVPALLELLRGRDRELSEAAGASLKRIGSQAVEPLVDALGTRNDRAVLRVLTAINAPAALQQAAARYGIKTSAKEPLKALLDRLERHLAKERRARLITEIDRALELGRESDYTEAFALLDEVYNQDRALYMSYARPIASLYLSRGERLFARGDYDAAILTLNTGLTIHQLPKIKPLLLKAQLALTRGFIELGDLERAGEVFSSIKGVQAPQIREVEGALLSKKAQNALTRGDYGRARTLIDQAKAIVQDDTELLLADRKLMLSENLAVVVVLVLLLPAFALAVVLYIRKRLDSARMRRLALEIDRAPTTSTHDTSA